MTYKTLGELRSNLAVRLGFGAAGSSGVNAPILDMFLQNAQDQLYAQFDWRHLVKYDEKVTETGSFLYDWATDCNQDRILDIAIHDGSRFVPMKEGISWAMRSDDSQTIPMRYERFQQMEIWPIPDAAYTMRRYYVQSLGRFTQDNDRASLDDDLIFLHALANAKAHYRHPDAQTYSSQLTAMMDKLKERSRGKHVHRRDDPDDVYLARPRDV